MTFIVSQACIDVRDKSCVEVCPVDCIYTDPEDRMCYIDPEACIDCAVCESACPVQAIFAADEAPADAAKFIEINARWFRDKAGARARVTSISPPG